MVYSNKFVVCVLHNGVPLEDRNGRVVIPFDSEFKLRFRNRNNRRAVVKFLIDGEEVSGPGYIVPANSFIDIERHHDVSKKFKFVSLDSADAIEHGKNGDNPDKIKGTIEARFYFEKEKPFEPTVIHHYHNTVFPTISPVYGSPSTSGEWPIINNTIGYCQDNSLSFCQNISSDTKHKKMMPRSKTHTVGTAGFMSSTHEVNTINNSMVKDGATVEGGYSSQRFSSTHIEIEDTYTSLKLFLQGHVALRKRPSVEMVEEVVLDETSNMIQKAKEEAKKLELEIARLRLEKLSKEYEALLKETS